MHIMEHMYSWPAQVQVREGEADVANKTSLRSDMTEEWGDESSHRDIKVPSINVGELEAVF
jgi:hypothetical protein